MLFISCYLSLRRWFYRDKLWLVFSQANNPYGSHPARLALRSLQEGSDGVFLPKWRWLTGVCIQGQVLRTDIVFQNIPHLSRITHLSEEGSFIFAGIMFWVEDIISQLARVYMSLLSVGHLTRHVGIIA